MKSHTTFENNITQELFNAIKKRDLDKVKLLINSENLRKTNGDNIEPVVVAAANNYWDIVVSLLLKYDLKNTQNNEHLDYVLLRCMSHERLHPIFRHQVMIRLLQLKAPVTLKSVDKYDYFYPSKFYILSNNTNITALHYATQLNDVFLVKKLLQAGADVNAVTEGDKYTPLHLAAMKGNAKIIKLLLEAGAEVNALTTHENSALSLMLEKNHLKCAEFFKNFVDKREHEFNDKPAFLILALNILFSGANKTFGKLPEEVCFTILCDLPEQDRLNFHNVFKQKTNYKFFEGDLTTVDNKLRLIRTDLTLNGCSTSQTWSLFSKLSPKKSVLRTQEFFTDINQVINNKELSTNTKTNLISDKFKKYQENQHSSLCEKQATHLLRKLNF